MGVNSQLPASEQFAFGREIHRSVPQRVVRDDVSSIADRPLYLASLSLLLFSFLSVKRLSAHPSLIVGGLGAALYFFNVPTDQRREWVLRRRMMLFTVLLISVYLITFSRNSSGAVFAGMEAASWLALTVLGFWLARLTVVRSLPREAPAMDLAVLALAAVSLIDYARVGILHQYYSGPIEPERHLTWVVVVSALLYYVLVDLARTRVSSNYRLHEAAYPLLVSCCIAALWAWL